MSNKPLFVISLDFELYWGMFDKVSLEEYGDNIKGVHTAIPELLSAFKQNQIHATWASVGMLMFNDKDSLLKAMPPSSLRPLYKDMSISSYEHIADERLGESAMDDPYHYGAHLIEKIIAVPHQELASHTFSHYYCQDGSENGKAVFTADCEAFAKIAERFSQPITSIVFPRNQTSMEALGVCRAQGFTAYRGTPAHFLYTGKKEKEQTSLLLRALRLIDAYINISGHHTFPLRGTERSPIPNIAGSRFLRPYSRMLRLLEPLRIARIKNSMTYAAKNNHVFHLWWHPHNFGINRKENMRALMEIIAHFKQLKQDYGMESRTMNEAVRSLNGSAV